MSHYFNNACPRSGLLCPDPLSGARRSHCVPVGALITGLLKEGSPQTVLTSRPDTGSRSAPPPAPTPGPFPSEPLFQPFPSRRAWRRPGPLSPQRLLCAAPVKTKSCIGSEHSSPSTSQVPGRPIPGQALPDNRGEKNATVQGEEAVSHSLHCQSPGRKAFTSL